MSARRLRSHWPMPSLNARLGFAFACAVTTQANISWAQTPVVEGLSLYRGDDRLSDVELNTQFNRAHCACDTDLSVKLSVTTDGTASGTFTVVHGRSCLSSGEISEDCVEVYSTDIEDAPFSVDETVSVAALAGGCEDKEETRSIYALFDADDDGEWSQIERLSFTVDTERPPSPTPTAALAGEELVEVAFAEPDSTSDVDKYQVLCRTSTAGGARPSSVTADFDSSEDLCGVSGDGVVASRVCAASSASTDSVTVLGLENGLSYIFEVVTIDEARNVSTPATVGEVIPAPEQDLWERYKDAGGSADGEHCFIATAAFGDYDHPQVRILRQFRDRQLLPTAGGRALVAAYYALSPRIASFLAHSVSARLIVRLALIPLVDVARVGQSVGWPCLLLSAALLMARGLARSWRAFA